MSFSGGVFSLVAGNPVVTGTTISSTTMNNTLSDIASGLSTCVLKDGSQTITANIPMSSFKLTGLAAGSASGDSLRYEQVNGLVTTAGDILQASGAGTLARLAIGTIGQVPTVNSGATALAYQMPTSLGSPVATTSGSTVNLSTTLPSGVRQIILGVNGISTNGTAKYQIQLSTGGTFATTGYVGSNGAAAFSGGFDLNSGSAANITSGLVVLSLIDTATNTWGCSLAGLGISNSGQAFAGGGIVPLSGVVDGVRITTTDTWDAGSISVSYTY